MTSMIRSDALQCEKIVRRHARTFTLASYFLPPRKRRAAFAFYAFCREADDIVDSAGFVDRKIVARKLQSYRRDLTEALEGRPRGPVFREVLRGVREFSIPSDTLFELLDGVARDLDPERYETWEDLQRYCEGVASTAGVMCAHVFGVPGGARQLDIAIGHARTLGVAMQLTNILRDVGEDARNGRCYLPEAELRRFAIERAEVLENRALAGDPRWNRLMTFQIARARTLYENALPGISMLSADSQRCAAACAIGYAAILDALEQINYDSVSTRASVGKLARIGILWDAWHFKRRIKSA
ncbi:MAG TPA: phytoene/squalene synthase family protein [Gemmatimonadaceae bacterium]|nr:phytoene/squalene synthase family protein [Gemmatimonadaceae bacterium]